MPLLDLPLNQLNTYHSQIKKPIDFHHYWKEQTIAVDNLELSFELIERTSKNTHAVYYDLNFKSSDGSIIHAKYIRPAHDEAVPLVLQFHDYKESSKSYFHLTRYVGMNYAVIAMDCRGQGGSSEDLSKSFGPTVMGHVIKGITGGVDELYYHHVYLDAYLLSRIAKKLPGIDCSQMMTYGIGQGGAIAISTAALNPTIKKCCARDPFLADFYRVWEMDLDIEAYEGLRYYFKWFDPMHEKELAFFETLSYIDIVNFATDITCDVLVGTSLLNKTSPPSTQFAFVNQLQQKMKHLLFHKHGHELNNTFENEALKFMGGDVFG